MISPTVISVLCSLVSEPLCAEFYEFVPSHQLMQFFFNIQDFTVAVPSFLVELENDFSVKTPTN